MRYLISMFLVNIWFQDFDSSFVMWYLVCFLINIEFQDFVLSFVVSIFLKTFLCNYIIYYSYTKMKSILKKTKRCFHAGGSISVSKPALQR